MKLFLLLMTVLFSINIYSQDDELNISNPEGKDDAAQKEALPAELQEAPPEGVTVIPDTQEQTGIDNPFSIGPYKDGEFKFLRPDEE